MSVPREIATASAITVATIEANCAGVSRTGGITRESRFVISVDGMTVAQAGSLDSAAHRLATAVRSALPRRRDAGWGVVVRCPLRPDVGLAFGNQAGGGGGGSSMNECVARIASEYNRGDNEFDRALEFAARLIQSCCAS